VVLKGNRQSEQYAREGIELSVSTMADHVGACAAVLTPLEEQRELELRARRLNASALLGGFHQQLGRALPGVAIMIALGKRKDELGGIPEGAKSRSRP
jgi:hypothetical protein